MPETGGAFNTGASIEVETGLSLFGTGDSWESATVYETIPNRSIELRRVNRV